ncbi:MAG: sigma-54-dependent transcriptional regulator [Gemmataceae bacterium]
MSQSKDDTKATGEEPLRVLVIDDIADHAEVVCESLQRVGYNCVIATSGTEGAGQIEQEDFDLVLTDLRMPDMDGLAILRKTKQELPDAGVIMITGHGDVQSTRAALKEGAIDFLEKPVNLSNLRLVVDKAADQLRLVRANNELKRQLDEKFGFEGVIGNSPHMHQIISKLKAVAPTSATVLIQGETGTGKELVAKAIHNNSPRKNKNFVALNCTAINESLLEDELFGHEPGAFTGADKVRKGRFEHANGGTLFLDEVGDMPQPLQAKLLRVLQDKEVCRVGSNEPIKVNVRLISATHRDLNKAVEEGKFRQDLYYRLKVVRIELPPLRTRREDIPILAAHFIKQFNSEHSKEVKGISEAVRKAMAAHQWEGNVRELRNMIESMVVQDFDGILDSDDLANIEGFDSLPITDAPSGPTNLVGRPLQEIDRYYSEKTLEMTGGNREEASRLLGIGERTLYRMIQDWKVQDDIRDALRETNGDFVGAAEKLDMDVKELERRMKKLGLDVVKQEGV